MDAVYPPLTGDIIMCYANNEERQDLSTDHDLAWMQYNSTDKIFGPTYSKVFTNSDDEIDNSELMNLNRPFKLLLKTDGTVLVSKKNEIVEVSDEYIVSPYYYSRDNYFGKGLEIGERTFVLNHLTP